MGRGSVMQRLTGMVSTPGRILLTTVVAALVILLSLAGVSQTLAIWNSQVVVSGSAGAAQLAVTTDFSGANAQFANHRTSVTGSFSLKNTTVTTSNRHADFTATIDATGAASMKSALTVTIWPRTGSTCTASQTPTGILVQKKWDEAPFTVSGTLAMGSGANTEAHYCMRTETSERSTLSAATGSMSINPSISATLSIGGWNKTVTDNTVQETSFIYPAQNPEASVWYQLKDALDSRCAVSPGSNNSAGSRANCSNNQMNQQWKFEQTGDGYQRIIPRNSAGIRLDTASDDVGAAVRTRNTSAQRISQQWQMQFKGNNTSGEATYQMVNRATGYCMQAASSAYTQQVCDDIAAQTFSLAVRGIDVTMPDLGCSSSGGNVTFSWTGATAGAYAISVRNGMAGNYTQVATAAPPAKSVTFTPAQLQSNLVVGENGLKVSYLGFDLATDTVWKNVAGGITTLSCEPPGLEFVNCVQTQPRWVTLSWGHAVPPGSTYSVDLVEGSGGTGATNVGTATAGSESHLLTAATAWADGTRTIRVSSSPGGKSIDVQIVKTGGTGNLSNQRLWCLTPVDATVTCSSTSSGSAITMLWPTTATGTSNTQVMVERTGSDNEAFGTVSHASGTSSFTISANNFSLGINGEQTIRMTLFGGNSGAQLLGDRAILMTGGTSKIWCANPVTVTTTCSSANYEASVTISWPTSTTGASNSQVLLRRAGSSSESSRSVTHASSGTSSFTIPADAPPLGSDGVQTVSMTLTGSAGAQILGEQTIQTNGTWEWNSQRSRNVFSYSARCI